MKLYSHQQRIIDESPKKTGLFLGTGSGKTRTALMLARGRTLVICPKTQKEDCNWEREFRVLVEYPKQEKDLTVISKETFRRDHESLPAFDTVIVDEAHTCLGVSPNVVHRKKVAIPKTSQLFEALDSYLERTKPERLYLCTATIIRSPMTVWAALKLLKGADMDSFRAFRSEYYTQLPMPGRDVWAPKRDSVTKDKLAALVRSLGYTGRLEDFFDVPEQTFKKEFVELTPKQKDRIKKVKLEFPDPIVQIGKKHQIENGVLAGDEFNEPEYFPNAKIDRILELHDEFPRMVVFMKYSAQIQALVTECDKRSIPVLILQGATTNRGQVIGMANDMRNCIFIAQAQISAGWELPEYPVMIFASCTYSYVDRAQAEGRILRANHLKKNLYIDLVVKGGVDEAVHESLINKKDFDERIYLGSDIE